jgi:glycosyltransferase involved in cell wall biosynthesis
VKKEWVINNEIPGCHEVLYNGIDIEKFQLKLSSKERLDERRKLNVSDDEILVIFCGRLIPEKGVKELLDAFELLSNEPIKLLLIGNVAFSGNSVTDFSIEIMKRAEAAPNIIPMGYIPNGQMPVYYAISDIQVVPSIWQEGAGLVAIEGMASGLPLIVTRSGGMVEYVDEKTAIQVPIDEELVDNLAKEIRYLACHEYERKTMGEFGSKRAGQFSKEQYYEDFIEIAKNGTDMCAKLRVIY